MNNNDDFQSQPPQPEPQEPTRPDSDETAADIARAKLQSIYDHDYASHAPGSRVTPDQDSQPQAQTEPSQPTPEPKQPTDSQTFNLPGSHQPDPQSAPSPQTHTDTSTPPQPGIPQPQQNSFDAFAAHRFGQQQSPGQPQQLDPQTPATFGTQQAHQPAINQLYGQETRQLNAMHPEQQHAAPDHQLGAANTHYELQSPRPAGIPSRFRPFLKTLVLALAIALFWNNQLILGKVQSYINPAQNVASPVIVDPTIRANVSDEPRIIIPKINVDVPVVYDITSYNDDVIQKGLERGVVHYGQTAVPGENGNNVIVGHSSNSFWNDGSYKFAFVLLDRLNNGDTFELHYNGERYIYEVFKKEVVSPTDVSVAFEQYDQPVTSLITCTPPGTNWNRLVVVAKQISPDPTEAKTVAPPEVQNVEDSTIPGDAPGFMDSLRSWF